MRTLLSTLVFMTIAGPTFAHPGHETGTALTSGFLHPLGGVDHIAVMLAVGLFAATLKGRALWMVPAAFVGMMAVGAAAGFAGFAVPFMEFGIIASIIGIGAMIAIGRGMSPGLASGIVGLFAVFHGQAHAVEMPATFSAFEYVTGFVMATALLHGAGIAVTLGLGRMTAKRGASRA